MWAPSKIRASPRKARTRKARSRKARSRKARTRRKTNTRRRMKRRYKRSKRKQHKRISRKNLKPIKLIGGSQSAKSEKKRAKGPESAEDSQRVQPANISNVRIDSRQENLARTYYNIKWTDERGDWVKSHPFTDFKILRGDLMEDLGDEPERLAVLTNLPFPMGTAGMLKNSKLIVPGRQTKLTSFLQGLLHPPADHHGFLEGSALLRPFMSVANPDNQALDQVAWELEPSAENKIHNFLYSEAVFLGPTSAKPHPFGGNWEPRFGYAEAVQSGVKADREGRLPYESSPAELRLERQAAEEEQLTQEEKEAHEAEVAKVLGQLDLGAARHYDHLARFWRTGRIELLPLGEEEAAQPPAPAPAPAPYVTLTKELANEALDPAHQRENIVREKADTTKIGHIISVAKATGNVRVKWDGEVGGATVAFLPNQLEILNPVSRGFVAVGPAPAAAPSPAPAADLGVGVLAGQDSEDADAAPPERAFLVKVDEVSEKVTEWLVEHGEGGRLYALGARSLSHRRAAGLYGLVKTMSEDLLSTYIIEQNRAHNIFDSDINHEIVTAMMENVRSAATRYRDEYSERSREADVPQLLLDQLRQGLPHQLGDRVQPERVERRSALITIIMWMMDMVERFDMMKANDLAEAKQKRNIMKESVVTDDLDDLSASEPPPKERTFGKAKATGAKAKEKKAAVATADAQKVPAEQLVALEQALEQAAHDDLLGLDTAI